MAIQDEFNMHFNRFKTRFPNASVDDFMKFTQRQNPQLFKQFSALQRNGLLEGLGQTVSKAGSGLFKGLGTVGKYAIPGIGTAMGIYQGLSQPVASAEKESPEYKEAVKNGFVPDRGDKNNAPQLKPTSKDNLLSKAGQLGTILLNPGVAIGGAIGKKVGNDAKAFVGDLSNAVGNVNQVFNSAGALGQFLNPNPFNVPQPQPKQANTDEDVIINYTNQPASTEQIVSVPQGTDGVLPPTTGLIMDEATETPELINNLGNTTPAELTSVNDAVPISNQEQTEAAAVQMAPIGNIMGAAANITDADVINQLVNPQGQITPEQMRGYIDQAYNAQIQAANRNPLYGGEYIQPGGYQIDENKLKYLRDLDASRRQIASIYGSDPNRFTAAQDYVNTQRQMYNAQMANRAGVPYEDYVAGMAKRNADEIAIRQKQAEAQLTAYAQQSTDMNTRLQIAQKIMHDRQESQNKIAEIYANMEKDLAVENMKGKWDYAKQGLSNTGTMQNTALQGANAMNLEQYKQTNPQAVFRNMAYFLYNAGIPLMGDKSAMARLLASQPQATQVQMFGRVITPQEAEILLNSMQTQEQSNPGWFANFLNPANYRMNFGQ